MSEEYILEMREITKEFPGVKALDQAQLLLRPGTIHALMGENGAGKSTLMKCLFGIYHKDSGSITINQELVQFANTRQALENGVSMVHQELNQVLKRSVMENIWLGRFPTKGLFVDEKKMYVDTQKIFADLGIELDPRIKIGSLSVSQRQMVEIAKAVSYDARILVLDEPTSSLTEQEVQQLFRIINQLKAEGCGIVYISHKIEEILEISDEVTIMRDGLWISTNQAKDLTTKKIINLMVGRSLENRFPAKTNQIGEVALEVRHLTGKYQPSVQDVSFTVHAGEILGIAGLVGARRTELLETIFGTASKETGEIILWGKSLKNRHSRESIKNRFALVTEERRANGIFAGLNVIFNTIIANINSYVKVGVVNDKLAQKDTAEIVATLNVKTPTIKTLMRSLSGGNQQKVIIGRWLLTDADVYLLDEPTRGIDVGAKFEIYQLIIELASRGKIVLVVSSEMSELLGIADRIMVMSDGRVAGFGDAKELTQAEILTLSAKYI